VQERVAYTFYSPETATKALVDEVFDIINDNMSALRILQFARSAQNHNMRDDISHLTLPTVLIWGLNDNITPPYVAHEFDSIMPNTTLRFIDHCGHAPMMEQAKIFNQIVRSFFSAQAAA
jgi:pimeloyl-ACP methyl ester carboxylesterase